VREVSCGGFHTVVLCESDEVFSWGDGKYGQLGNEKEDNECTP
jgi:alpha-tubulin suppressor-like RCC1 family protein